MKLFSREQRILRSHKIRSLTNFRTSGVLKHFSLPLLTLITFLFCLLSACGNNSSLGNIPDSPLQTSDCRVIEHAMGKTCVPLSLQRVITIDPFSLENVLAFGIQPIGIASDSEWIEERYYLQERLAGVEFVGGYDQPNLEKILMLKPDLILGLDSVADTYGQLSQIAPTILSNFKSSSDWQKILMHNAEALGKTDVAKQLMEQYYSRLEEFKRQMGDRLTKTKVSVVRIYPEGIDIYRKNTFIGVVLEDAGLPRPAAQIEDMPGRLTSKELIHDADGDVIFVWSNESGQRHQEVQAIFDKLQNDPLWNQLNAVRQGKVLKFQVIGLVAAFCQPTPSLMICLSTS